MPKLQKIPERYKSGLTRLAKLEDNLFNSLIDWLQKTPISLGIDKLVISFNIPDKMLERDIENILESIGSLSGFGERQNILNEELVNQVTNLISNGGIEDLKSLTPIQIKRFEERVLNLLKNETVYYSTKSVDVLTEHEHVFHSSRILTDCRPVFGMDIENNTKVALILHALQIHYHENEQHKEMYFALDSEDLSNLKETIERAEKRAEKIKSTFLQPEIKILE